MIKKFYEIYLVHSDKEKFINEVLNKYPNMKYSSAQRRWYECRKHNLLFTYPPEEKEKPTVQKMIIFNDLKKYYKNLTPEILKKHYFNNLECNWLREEGLL